MKSRTRLIGLALGGGLITLLAAGLLWAQEYSHARVVRLSYAEGTVSLQRPDVPDWAEAPVNTPLQEGFKLATAEKSFAEVEFENGSTVRVGQLSLLEFTQLALQSSGGKINRLALQQGYATFHAMPEGDDVYEVTTAQGLLVPRGKALFRVDMDENVERVEVFKGTVDVSSNLGSWSLAKNDVLELHPGSNEPYTLSQGITRDAWDEWVSGREERTQMAPAGAPSPGLYSNDTTYLVYGWQDLSSYGAWSNLVGYGYGWIPNVGPGWSPFTLGRWIWYPGLGWVWIPSEPWGWLPCHYGYWNFLPGIGWAWFPGSFGYWSPAQVWWYSGPDWIGWVPRGSPQGGHTNSCPEGQTCGAAVSTTYFRAGGIIPSAIRQPVNPSQGQPIDHPGLPSVRSGGLPPLRGGTPWRPTPGVSQGPPLLRSGTHIWQRPSPPPDAEVVFDPAQGRYVNSPLRPQPVQPSAGPGMTPGGVAVQPGGAVRPRPVVAPGTPSKNPPPGGGVDYISPAPPAGSNRPNSMGPPRDAAPRSSPTVRERPSGDTRGNSPSPQRSGGEGQSFRGGGSEGGSKPSSGPAGGASVRGGDSGAKPYAGSSPRPH